MITRVALYEQVKRSGALARTGLDPVDRKRFRPLPYASSAADARGQRLREHVEWQATIGPCTYAREVIDSPAKRSPPVCVGGEGAREVVEVARRSAYGLGIEILGHQESLKLHEVLGANAGPDLLLEGAQLGVFHVLASCDTDQMVVTVSSASPLNHL